jgi:hypothetical protein
LFCRQVFFSEDDFPKSKSKYEDDIHLSKSYDDDLSKTRYDDDLPKKRYDEDLPKKRYGDDNFNKKQSYNDLSLKKRSDEERRTFDNGRRYLSEQNGSSRDVVDSGIENDHPKQRTRTAERTSSRVSERTSSRVSTLRRNTSGRESPAMQSARLVQQASKSSSPRRRSLSILDEDGVDNTQDNNRYILKFISVQLTLHRQGHLHGQC